MDFLNTVINSPVFNALSITLLHFVWQGCVIALFLYTALKLISNKYSNLRYNLSLFALTLCLIAPCITYLIIYSAQTTTQENFLSSSALMPNIETSLLSYLPLLSVLWLIGVTYFSFGYCKELVSINRLSKTQVEMPEKWMLDIFLAIKISLKVTQNVRLLISKLVDVPIVIGWIKPVVLIPINMVSGLTNEQLKLLIAHELAHVKRHDYFINLIQSLVEVFLFYHPAVKWISKQIRIDREYCCDDIAVNTQNVTIDYAKALLNAEELRPHTIPNMAMAATGGDLKSRVSRVVGEHTCTPKHAKSGLAGLLGLFVVCFMFSSYKVVAMVQSKDLNGLESLQNISLQKDHYKKVEKAITPESTASPKKLKQTKMLDPEGITIKPNKEIKNTNQLVKSNALPKQNISAAIPKMDEVEIKQNIQAIESLIQVSDYNSNIEYNSLNLNAIKEDIKENIQNLTYESLNNKINIEIPDKESLKVYAPLVIPPKTLKMVNPIYNEAAQRRGYKGDVVIEFTVDLTGKATDIEFVGETRSHLKRAVKKAIKKWEFSPGTVNGNEAVMRETKLFSFVKPDRDKMTITTGSRILRR